MLSAGGLDEAFWLASSPVHPREVAAVTRDRIVQTDTLTHSIFRLDSGMQGLDRMMLYDYCGFLRDQVLVKVDRASMSVSLEAREPLLDHRIFEAASRISAKYRYAGGDLKWILKEILARHVPRELFERPKAGFQPPIHQWLKDDFEGLIESHLSPEEMKGSRWFNPVGIRHLISSYRAGRTDSANLLWFVLVWQMWDREWLS
jgi:asparagine synthase (glutamine-hydrolysing)